MSITSNNKVLVVSHIKIYYVKNRYKIIYWLLLIRIYINKISDSTVKQFSTMAIADLFNQINAEYLITC